jgi:hypothetical protein
MFVILENSTERIPVKNLAQNVISVNILKIFAES